MSATSTVPPCPYRGLQPYTEADRAYFFGRERDRELIIANLYASPLTVLYGASGVGKSSVLMAGVVPQLHNLPRVVPVVWRDWQSAQFETALKAQIVKMALAASAQPIDLDPHAPLDDLLLRAAGAARAIVFLIFDQFEEYFLYRAPNAKANGFEAELASVVNRGEVEAHLLFALREDGLSKLDRFEARIPNLFRNLLRLEHLDRKGGADAIRKPLEVFRARYPDVAAPTSIEDSLVEALLDEARPAMFHRSAQRNVETVPGGRTEESHVETPLLQMVLFRLWTEETAASSKVLPLATFDRLGRARGIASTHVDSVMAQLSDPERDITARILRFLVTPAETKIAHDAAVVASWAELNEADVDRVLVRLASPELRILREVDVPGQRSRYEIFHDVLAPAVLDWRRRFVERQTEERIRREAEERRLRDAEETKRQEEMRRVVSRGRLVRAILGAALLVAAALAGLAATAWVQRNRALEYLRVANEQRIAADTQREAARQATALAEQRLKRILESMQLKRAALSGNPDTLAQALSSEAASAVTFGARAVPYGYKNEAGQPVYRFELFPEPKSVSGGLGAIAFITYKMDHPTFRNTLMLTGPDRGFAASYDGWGCLRRVIAVIEYTNPDQAPTIAQFDMCSALDW